MARGDAVDEAVVVFGVQAEDGSAAVAVADGAEFAVLSAEVASRGEDVGFADFPRVALVTAGEVDGAEVVGFDESGGEDVAVVAVVNPRVSQSDSLSSLTKLSPSRFGTRTREVTYK